MNKTYILTALGVLGSPLITTNANAQTFYQCMPLACKNGQYIKDGKCTDCSAGTYQSGNDRATSCSPCPSGKYSGAGATSCTTCEPGNYCSGGIKYACGAGKYSGAGATSCSTCEAGSYCTGGKKYSCSAGQYSGNGASSCSTCSAGTYSSAGASSCKPCSAGQYQDATGQASCKSCSAGQYQNEAGKSSCKSCSAGQISGVGATSCSTCAEGKYASNNTCVTCEAGSYCTGGVKYECPIGYYCEAGSSSPTVCEYQTPKKQLTIYYICSGGGCAAYRHDTVTVKLSYGKNSYDTLFSGLINEGLSKSTTDTKWGCSGTKTFSALSWNGSVFNYGGSTGNLILSCNDSGKKYINSEALSIDGGKYCSGSVNAGAAFSSVGGGCCFKGVGTYE